MVEDNGCGMKKEKVMELNQRLESGKISELTENAKSVRPSNVNVRLKNFYGKECGIRVESQPGEFQRLFCISELWHRKREDNYEGDCSRR